MYFTLRKKFRFEASHQLKYHDGKCARLHGHSWVMIVEVGGTQLQNDTVDVITAFEPKEVALMPDASVSVSGIASEVESRPNPKRNMLMDYADIKSAVQPIVDEVLDHWHLNETLQTDSPTSEFIARELFRIIRAKLPSLRAIEIEETCTASCRYE